MDAVLTRRIVPAGEKINFKPISLDALIGGRSHLPPSFELIPRLLLLLDDPETNCEDLADIIRVDPGLTANLFRISNSATVGGARKAASLSETILRLGLREVYRIVIEIVTTSALKTTNPFSMGRVDLWKHSLATAVAAQTLARHLTQEDPEVVFSAGLLHDIGKAGLGQAAGRDYLNVLEVCAETNRALHEAEREAFRTDHTEVGGRLLRAWKFPERIFAAVAGHHWPTKLSKENGVLAALIYAGNVLAYRIGEGNGFPMYAALPDEDALGIIGLTPEDLPQYEEEISEMLRREQDRVR
jgi:putative nucleotidyltransferase with HDIG domain